MSLPGAIAVGSFDGIHRGHEAVIREALAQPGEAVVVCFEPSPRQVFSEPGNRLRLTTPGERGRILGLIGVHRLLAWPFDGDTRNREPAAFFEDLHGIAGFRHIVVGYDFHFGRDRTGSVGALAEWCDGHGIGLTVVPPLEEDGQPVKSERVRALVREGRLGEASRLLGRPYCAIGAIARGRGFGRKLGFPTLNVRVPRPKLLPPPGSYAAVTILEGRRLPAAVFVPRHGQPFYEAHLPGWSGEIYGEAVCTEFVQRLRAPEDLDGRALADRIADDVKQVMEVMGE
jgi:riboflavin kinase/FMN adenylyltransferase